MLAIDDIMMIGYFWKETGNIERWGEWEEKTALLQRECPELIKAWNDYKAPIKVLDAVVDQITMMGEG